MTDDELLAEIRECDGYEMHIEHPDFAVAKELQKEGLVTIGAPRGPDRMWVRLELAEEGQA